MMDNNECIFCFESFSPKDDDTLHFHKRINKIYNKKLALSCNHEYHLGCTITYINTLYGSWKKKREIDYLSKFFITCPYCRSIIDEHEIMSIIYQFNAIKRMKDELYKKLSRLRSKILWLKIKLHSKKFLNLKNLPSEVFEYHRIVDEYEDLGFLKTKINYLTKDTDSLADRITKRNNILLVR